MSKTLLVVDIDNTVAENGQREHLLPNWSKFFKACDTDTPIVEIIDAIRPLFDREDIDIVFVTGRNADPEVIEKTQKWLLNHLPEREIFFRPLRDYTKAPLFKQGVVEEYKKDHHTNIIIMDDDVRICDHFESLGHKAIRIVKDDYQLAVDMLNNLFSRSQVKPQKFK